MNRRMVLRNFALTGVAALVLPGCFSDSKKKVTDTLNELDATEEDERLLSELAATLIPATDKPGARETGAHLFTFVMVGDCLPPAERETFLKGLRSFNKSAPVPSKSSFLEASPEERLATLKILNDGSASDELINSFYKTARRYIIEGYTTSQYFMTEVKPYQLVPGAVYKGCVPLSEDIQL